MARHIRVPGIVDVVLVSDPAEIRALNDHAKIDRNFIPRGPLINRLIDGRIRHWFEIMGQSSVAPAAWRSGPRRSPARACDFA